MTRRTWTAVKKLEPGDEFGPLANDSGVVHTVVMIERSDRVPYVPRGTRYYYDVRDENGNTWRTGAERLAGDCYGWKRIVPYPSIRKESVT